MGRATALEQWQDRHPGHLLLRDDPVAGGEPQAAFAQGHDPVGRRCRHVSRLRLSRRHFLLRFREQLVQQPHGAPLAWKTAGVQPRYLCQTLALALHAGQPRYRLLSRPAGAVGKHRHPALYRRQLERHGAASARQHRSFCARQIETQKTAHSFRHALPPVLRGRSAQGPVTFFRSLVKRQRYRVHERAPSQAADTNRRREELPVALRKRVAARAHPMDAVLFAARQTEPAQRRLGRRPPCDHGAEEPRQRHLSRKRYDKSRRRFGFMDLHRACRQPAAYGRIVRNRTAARRYGNHRSDQPGAMGLEFDRRHGHIRDTAQYWP